MLRLAPRSCSCAGPQVGLPRPHENLLEYPLERSEAVWHLSTDGSLEGAPDLASGERASGVAGVGRVEVGGFRLGPGSADDP